MDFYKIQERSVVRGRGERQTPSSIEIFPDFIVKRSKDLMIRGKNFYAVWNEPLGLWSKDEYDVAALVDEELYAYRETLLKNTRTADIPVKILSMASNKSRTWSEYKRYISTLADNYHELDERLTFLNTEVKKEDYVSRRLSYALEDGDYSAWDELVSTLYDPSEREKIEWAIGAVVSGDSRSIQKFCVFYGEPGTGKGTIITILQKLFAGYYATFNAKDLGSTNNQFATEVFRSNPLVAIQHDGDLSRIEDNTKLNSIISHEMMVINEKGKPQYMGKMNAFLFMGTNRPVKITDSRSGIIRRLIDIFPSGRRIDIQLYDALMSQIDFQLGAIAKHCLDVYRELGKNYYKNYQPRNMIAKTDVFYNFVEANLDVFEAQDGISLNQAYAMYKEYCDDSLVEFKLPRYKFREELKTYYDDFDEIARVDGKQIRSWFSGFRRSKMEPVVLKKEEHSLPLVLDCTESLLDRLLADCPAQYATMDAEEKPLTYWSNATTKLRDLNTRRVHYILPRDAEGQPLKLIMIDFDLKDENGKKNALLNLQAASQWPKTYAEYSKGGAGLHLIYWYNGDVRKLKSLYAPNIEVKVFTGNLPMRRRLSWCNNVEVTTLEEGALPLKEDKNMLSVDDYKVKDKQHLINKIMKSLRKEDNVGGTKCEIEFIKKTLDDAYASGMSYDVSELQHDIFLFGQRSTNNKALCRQLVNQMKFRSKDYEVDWKSEEEPTEWSGKSGDGPIAFFDVEVYPPGIDEDGEENEGLFLICWKLAGADQPVHAMVNPTPTEVADLFRFRLIGFNNLAYDNFMVYARFLGYSNARLYDLSQRLIIENARDIGLQEAKAISYTDVFDYASEKMSLKKWEIRLDIDHIEMGIRWDLPAPKRLWQKVIEYCSNDVIATEKVHENRIGDFIAREILAELAGGTPNDTTNTLTTRFIFGRERNPKLVYTDLATGEQSGGSSPEGTINAFPGYQYVWSDEKKKFVNLYRGVDVGRGGYVYSEPGYHFNVALLDIQSMHPNSAVNLHIFGEYTERFKEILDARIAIKNGDFDRARKMFDGKLAKYLDDESKADALAQALKIAINSVYGLTSAGFVNPFRDERNVNNIVALRGALFMKTLQDEVAARGFAVAHIKTDSIKIPNATPEIIQFCMDFAKKYGYIFEHEATYERMCLLDKAQYVAAYMRPEECEKRYGYAPKDNRKHFKKHDYPWTTTGDAFQHPYIFKTLFSGEPVTFGDRCETKSVRGAEIYLDFNEGYPDVKAQEKALEKNTKKLRELWGDNFESMLKELSKEIPSTMEQETIDKSNELVRERQRLLKDISAGHNYQFVGRVGRFYPVRPGAGGGWLISLRGGKYGSINGAKDIRWMEAPKVRLLGLEDAYDPDYFDRLIDGAIAAGNAFGDFQRFMDMTREYIAPKPSIDNGTWTAVPCGDPKRNSCLECSQYFDGDRCLSGYSLASYVERGKDGQQK